jgi:hypothetical protein
VAGSIGMAGRLQSVQVAAFVRNPRPTSSKCATLTSEKTPRAIIRSSDPQFLNTALNVSSLLRENVEGLVVFSAG